MKLFPRRRAANHDALLKEEEPFDFDIISLGDGSTDKQSLESFDPIEMDELPLINDRKAQKASRRWFGLGRPKQMEKSRRIEKILQDNEVVDTLTTEEREQQATDETKESKQAEREEVDPPIRPVSIQTVSMSVASEAGNAADRQAEYFPESVPVSVIVVDEPSPNTEDEQARESVSTSSKADNELTDSQSSSGKKSLSRKGTWARRLPSLDKIFRRNKKKNKDHVSVSIQPHESEDEIQKGAADMASLDESFEPLSPEERQQAELQKRDFGLTNMLHQFIFDHVPDWDEEGTGYYSYSTDGRTGSKSTLSNTVTTAEDGRRQDLSVGSSFLDSQSPGGCDTMWFFTDLCYFRR